MAATFLSIKKAYWVPILIFLVVLLPLWMWLAWLISSKRKLVIAIVDKTVLTRKGQEHISLDWILTQQKFTKNTNELYKSDRDYFGRSKSVV